MAIVFIGKASLISFLLGSANVLIPIFGYLVPPLWPIVAEYFVLLLLIHAAGTVIPMIAVYKGFASQVEFQMCKKRVCV